MRVGLIVFFTIIIGLFSLRASAADSRRFGDWALFCPDSEAACTLSQTIASVDYNWLATLRIALSKSKEAEVAVVQFLVPPNVHLASGLFSVVAPGKALQATFIRCSTNACEAVMGMDIATLDAWKQGRVAELRYRPAVDVPPVIFDVSLIGLTAGLNAAAGSAN